MEKASVFEVYVQTNNNSKIKKKKRNENISNIFRSFNVSDLRQQFSDNGHMQGKMLMKMVALSA